MKQRSVRWIKLGSVKEDVYVIDRQWGMPGMKRVDWVGRSHPFHQVHFAGWDGIVSYADVILAVHRLQRIDWGTRPLRYEPSMLELRVRVERRCPV